MRLIATTACQCLMMFVLLHDGRVVLFPERGDERQGANDDSERHVSIPGGLKTYYATMSVEFLFLALGVQDVLRRLSSLGAGGGDGRGEGRIGRSGAKAKR